jgi:DNA-binding NtrC family response regulator
VRPDLVLLDIWMPDTDGITLLKEWASTGQLTMPVVMMSGHGTIDTAVEATRIGAYAFLEKPIALQKLLSTIGTALKQGVSKAGVTTVLATVGKSRPVDQLRAQLERLRALKSPALFVGEPGTGMEQCARLLHQPNTAWLAPEDLAAFDQPENNLVGQAAEGILYLRDVDTMSRSQQKSLMAQTLKLDRYNSRIVSSTSAPLPELVAGGVFDPRLYALLAGVIVRVPALRERAEDIPILAEYWMSRHARTVGKTIRGIDESAMAALCAYPWPGNIRELQNVVERAVILARGNVLGLGDFELPDLGSGVVPPNPERPSDERQGIERALAASRGRVYGAEGAAETLGVPPSTLEARIRRLGIDKHAFRRRTPRP